MRILSKGKAVQELGFNVEERTHNDEPYFVIKGKRDSEYICVPTQTKNIFFLLYAHRFAQAHLCNKYTYVIKEGESFYVAQ